MKRIEKLNINMFPESSSLSEYNKAKAEFISEYEEYIPDTREYHIGGPFTSGYWTGEEGGNKKNPILGEAEWNKLYPDGYEDWANSRQNLTATGEQLVINKINELVLAVNKLSKTNEK